MMAELQKASRGNPAPRGGVTGRLEGNIAQGTGKSKLPWEKSTTPSRRQSGTRSVEGGARIRGFSVRGGQGGGGGGIGKDKNKIR
jgi:hypothetical protein